jgi:hypothetical protein
MRMRDKECGGETCAKGGDGSTSGTGRVFGASDTVVEVVHRPVLLHLLLSIVFIFTVIVWMRVKSDLTLETIAPLSCLARVLTSG